jgi:hypothetical protein
VVGFAIGAIVGGATIQDIGWAGVGAFVGGVYGGGIGFAAASIARLIRLLWRRRESDSASPQQGPPETPLV